MSSETMPSETASSAIAPAAHADVTSDAALIIAALGRMEAVVRDERAAISRLCNSLDDMAQAIARAKGVADSEIAAAMLDEFEHRIDAMIEIARGTHTAPAVEQAAAPAAELAARQPAESDQVPTVSGVVLALGPNDEGPPRMPRRRSKPRLKALRPSRC